MDLLLWKKVIDDKPLTFIRWSSINEHCYLVRYNTSSDMFKQMLEHLKTKDGLLDKKWFIKSIYGYHKKLSLGRRGFGQPNVEENKKLLICLCLDMLENTNSVKNTALTNDFAKARNYGTIVL